jgi:hypothetical protein
MVNRCTRRSGAASDVLLSMFLFMAGDCPTVLALMLVLASPRELLLPALTFEALLPSPPVPLKLRFSGAGAARPDTIDSVRTFNIVKIQDRCCASAQSIAAAVFNESFATRSGHAVFAAGAVPPRRHIWGSSGCSGSGGAP